MIVGTGVDIVSVARFERANGERFMARCFTEREMAYLTSRGTQSGVQGKVQRDAQAEMQSGVQSGVQSRVQSGAQSGVQSEAHSEAQNDPLGKVQSRAGLFAAKEAVVKALGTGFRGFWPCAVEILHDTLGRPYAVLHGEAARIAKQRRITRIWVSITHETATAVAVAVAERTERHASRNHRANARGRGLRHS